MSVDPIRGALRPLPIALPDTLQTRPTGTGTAGSALNATVTAPSTATTATTPSAEMPPSLATLPASGIDADTRRLIHTLLRQFGQRNPSPLKLLNAQPWPLEWVQQALPDELGPSLPTLRPWLAQQGTWQTRQGTQGFVATLHAPASWLTQPTPHTALAALPPTVRIVTEQPQAMASEAWALALTTAEGEPLSVVLTLEFGATRHPLPYGPDLFHPRQDAWLQQAVVLAHAPRQQTPPSNEPPADTCQETACPYFRRAACPQPFCPKPVRVTAIEPDG